MTYNLKAARAAGPWASGAFAFASCPAVASPSSCPFQFNKKSFFASQGLSLRASYHVLKSRGRLQAAPALTAASGGTAAAAYRFIWSRLNTLFAICVFLAPLLVASESPPPFNRFRSQVTTPFAINSPSPQDSGLSKVVHLPTAFVPSAVAYSGDSDLYKASTTVLHDPYLPSWYQQQQQRQQQDGWWHQRREQQREQKDQPEQQQQQYSRTFASWLFAAICCDSGCSTVTLAVFAAIANATFATLLLFKAWRHPLRAEAAKGLGCSTKSCSSSNGDTLLPVERERLWPVAAAAKSAYQGISSFCCSHIESGSSNDKSNSSSSSEHKDTTTPPHSQLLGENKWMPWLLAKESMAAAATAVDEEAYFAGAADVAVGSVSFSANEAPTAPSTAAAAQEGDGALLDVWAAEVPGDLRCNNTGTAAEDFAMTAADAAAAAAHAAEAEAEAAALEKLLQSYSRRPPLLQWVIYFALASLWALGVYELAAAYGLMLGVLPGAAGAIGFFSGSSSGVMPAAAAAHALLLVLELLLGLSFAWCLLAEAAFIADSSKRHRQAKRLRATALLLCCCFCWGVYCFWSDIPHAAVAAAPDAALTAATAKAQAAEGGFSFVQQLNQQNQKTESRMQQPRIATAAATLETEGFSTAAEGRILGRKTVGFRPFFSNGKLVQWQQKQQRQQRPGRHQKTPPRSADYEPHAVFLQLQPPKPYTARKPVTNSSSGSTGKERRYLRFPTATAAATAVEGTSTSRRRLSASFLVPAASPIPHAKQLDKDEAKADDTSNGSGSSDSSGISSSSDLWQHVLLTLKLAVEWGIPCCKALRLWAAKALEAVPMCCILLPLLLLRVAAAAITIELVRHHEAFVQKRDSLQKNSLQWLVRLQSDKDP